LSAQSFESLAVVADMAREAGVVLFAVDRRINAEPGTDYAVWIGGDYRDQGRLAAQELLAAIYEEKGEYKANIVEIQGIAGSSAAIDRAAGFADEIDKHPDVTIIASQDGEFSRDSALIVMENYLQKFGAGEIDAVYTHNDEMAIGAVEAIEKAGRDELLGWIVSVDGQREALELVIDGKMLATAQCPAGYGDLSMEMALNYLDGEEVPTEIYIPFEAFSNRTPELLARTQEYLAFLVENDLKY
jgi:ribose transport system substrate-binding protein